ncbi:MAG: hypothetical protein HY881_24240 [Deltaproteobacteria bacterium]|nr:hypothetical protein [Deltaproteobacteria bacterium]
MKSNFMIMSLTIIALSIITSCASVETARHEYIMRGQVLESTRDGIYLCIGSADGAEVGQEFKVYKFERMQDLKPMQPNYKREETGTVKITEIVDEHYAKAKVLTGEVKVNYLVELHK